MSTETLLKTPLHALHIELGARMVPFAGYDMPVQYPLGVMKEHLHTREQAGLFDVSHMGQIRLTGAVPPRPWKPWCRWTSSTCRWACSVMRCSPTSKAASWMT